jgi:hypothetical protein
MPDHDASVPQIARVYDYGLSGKGNSASAPSPMSLSPMRTCDAPLCSCMGGMLSAGSGSSGGRGLTGWRRGPA